MPGTVFDKPAGAAGRLPDGSVTIGQRKLPEYFQAQLDRAISARAEDRVGRHLVGGAATAAEVGRGGRIVPAGSGRTSGVGECRMVQDVKDLGPELR